MSRRDKKHDNRIVSEEDLVITSLDEDENYYYDEVEVVTHEEGKPALSIVSSDEDKIVPVAGYKKPMDFDVDAELAAMEAHEKGLDEVSLTEEAATSEDETANGEEPDASEDLDETTDALDEEPEKAESDEDMDEYDDEPEDYDEESEDDLEYDSLEGSESDTPDDFEADEEDPDVADSTSDEDFLTDDADEELNASNEDDHIIAFPGSEDDDESKPVRHVSRQNGPSAKAKLARIVIIVALLAVAAFGGIKYREYLDDKHAREKAEEDISQGQEEPADLDEIYAWWNERDTKANERRVLLGSFAQGPRGEVEPISWIKIAEIDGKQLLISEYVIDLFAFSTEDVVQWENSDLRKYLNGAFLEKAFTKEEQKKIKKSKHGNHGNGASNTSSSTTVDKIFVLSNQEIMDYQGEFSAATLAVPYIIEKGAREDSKHYAGYWLRCPGQQEGSTGKPGYAAVVEPSGEFDYLGVRAKEVYGVRVALFINIE